MPYWWAVAIEQDFATTVTAEEDQLVVSVFQKIYLT